MNKIKIMTVCGFGVGTSLILKMNIESVLNSEGIEAEVFSEEIMAAPSNNCDLIFTSKEFYEELKNKVKVPVIEINNFLSKDEIKEKGLDVIKGILK